MLETMFSPIRACEVEAASCHAHIIPSALNSSNKSVESEEDFDNQFGALNDSILVKFIRNLVEEDKDAVVMFVDKQTTKKLHTSAVKAKTTIKYDENTGRAGNIVFKGMKPNLASRVGLGVGTFMGMKIFSPNPEEEARIGLSILHSSYLTMVYNFGSEYVKNACADIVRSALIDSISNSMKPETKRLGQCELLVTKKIVETFQKHNINKLKDESFADCQHPISIWKCSGSYVFGVFLPYNSKCTVIGLLPGFGKKGLSDFQRWLAMIEGDKPLPIIGSTVSIWKYTKSETALTFWDRITSA